MFEVKNEYRSSFFKKNMILENYTALLRLPLMLVNKIFLRFALLFWTLSATVNCDYRNSILN